MVSAQNPPLPGAQKSRSGKLVDGALDHLRQEILSGHRRPGQRVQESVLAKELGTSRAPVREALRILEQSGLLVKNPNHSYTVRQFTDKDLYELATLRVTLESFAAELAFGNPETASRLMYALESLRAAEQSGDAAAVIGADRQFHRALVECADHSRLLRSYDGLLDEVGLALRSIDRRQPSIEGTTARHEALVRQFSEGTLEDLLRDLSTHIRAGSGLSHLAAYLATD
jgi:DNA-binding GntR family transcriptional regulator